MQATGRQAGALLLTGVLAGGCGTPDVLADHWTYRGNDEALRAPPRVPRGDLSGSEWIQALRENEARWFQMRGEVIEQAKDDCARATGASKTPNDWTGYSAAFKQCMAARGWIVGRSPL